MRVAFVLMDFPVKSETFVLRDIRSLKEYCSKVDVFTLTGPGMFKSHAGIDVNRNLQSHLCSPVVEVFLDFIYWVRFILFNEPKFIEKLKLLALLPRCLKIANAVRLNNYHIVHLYWGHYPSLLGLILKQRSASNIVSLFLGAYDLEKKLKISKLMSFKADVRWTHAQGNLKKLKRLGFPMSDQYIVNYRSFDVSKIPYLQIPRKDRTYDFITVGRLIEAKGVMEALYAFRELKLEGIKFKYAIVGDGPLKEKCLSYVTKNALTDYIDFYGHLPEESVFALMQNSRNFILLSEKKGECLPNVIKEAILNKCYIISGLSDCIEELIPNDKVGIIVRRFNHQKIVKYLKHFLQNRTSQDIEFQDAIIRKNFEIQNSSRRYLKEWGKLYER